VEKLALHWWLVEDGAVSASGCDHNPLTAANILPAIDAEEAMQVIALLPSTQSVVRWHEVPKGVTDQQALAAAIVDARAQSLNPDDLHVAAVRDDNGLATASVAADRLTIGLTQLQSLGLDPDAVIPSGYLLDIVPENAIIADFGFDRVLRAPGLIAADEPLVRNHLVSAGTITELQREQLDAAIVSADSHIGINLRTGIFAKKTKRQMTSDQKKNLSWLFAAVLLISISIPLLQLYKYHSATNSAEEAAIDAASKVIGPANNLDMAEQKLDEKLLADNLGNSRFTVPASGLFSALQQSPGVSINRLSYGSNGLLSVELTAIRNEDINPALIAIQNQGFSITATPRQDATGAAKADVTVRVP